MTVSTSLARVQYSTNGTTGPWSVPFYFLADADLQVIYTDADGNETTLVLNTDFTATGSGDPAGGTVTTTTAYASGGYVTVLRDMDYTQEVDYTDTDAFPAETHEQALDRLTMLVQQVKEVTDRALVFSPSDTEGSALPAASARASQMLGFDSLGRINLSVPAEGTAAALALDLADTASVSKGSAMVGFNPALAYAATNTVAIWLRRMLHASGFPTLQAAIDEAISTGAPLVVDRGTWSVATTGSTTAPVGDALTIDGALTMYLLGDVVGTNNCNVLHVNAGATDRVRIFGAGGQLRGYGTYFWLTNKNGACLKVSGGDFESRDLRLVDPPQYAAYIDGVAKGVMYDTTFVGGPTTYSGVAQNNHYGICLVDGATDWKLHGVRGLAGGTGGRVSQGIASLTFTSGTADRLQVTDYKCSSGAWEKGTYIFGDDVQLDGVHVYDTPNGEGIRVIGKRQQLSGIHCRSNIGGGITMYNAEGSTLTDFSISDYEASGLSIGYSSDSLGDSTVTGKSLNDITLASGSIKGKSSGTALGRAVDIRGHSATNVTIARLALRGIDIDTANYDTSDLAALDIYPSGGGATTFQDLELADITISNAGSRGVRFRAGIYAYATVRNVQVRDPAMTVNTRSAFVWEASVTWVGQEISGCAARADSSTQMSYGFDNNASANIQSTLIRDNHSRGHLTAGYLNLQHATNTRSGNRLGDASLHGTFTLAAAASTTVSNSNAQTAGMRLRLTPTNAAAATLMQGTKSLYFDGTAVAGTSFTVKTADGTAAAGTETFDYELSV